MKATLLITLLATLIVTTSCTKDTELIEKEDLSKQVTDLPDVETGRKHFDPDNSWRDQCCYSRGLVNIYYTSLPIGPELSEKLRPYLPDGYLLSDLNGCEKVRSSRLQPVKKGDPVWNIFNTNNRYKEDGYTQTYWYKTQCLGNPSHGGDDKGEEVFLD